MIEFKNVSLVFNNNIVIDHLNLIIPNEAKVVSIIGPSGSGKTTFARLILGLLKPSDGQIICPQNIGFVDQNSTLFTNMTAYQNIKYVTNIKETRKYEELMINMNLTQNDMDKYPSQLSGGQRQKVAIMREVLRQNSTDGIIIFDEPTASLDKKSVESFANIIKDIQNKLNIQTIIITHDLNLAKNISDYCISMLETDLWGIKCKKNSEMNWKDMQKEINQHAL